MVSARTVQPHRVRVYGSGTWAVRSDLEFTGGSEGSGQIMGEFTLLSRFGTVRDVGATTSPATRAKVTDIRGKMVNVQIYNATSEEYEDLTSGVCVGDETDDTGSQMGHVLHHCNGIGYILSRYRVSYGCEFTGASIASTVVGYMPPFNSIWSGDMSNAGHSIDGKTIRIHDRFTAEAKWTAKHALEYILQMNACYYDIASDSYLRHISWTVDDTLGLLDYELDTIDLNGVSVLDAVNTLINVRRGITHRITLDSSTNAATIAVYSTSPVAYSGGGFELKASTKTVTVTLTGVTISNLRLAWSEDRCADVIEVVGERPWTAISVFMDQADTPTSSLEYGWEPEEEDLWDTSKDNQDNVWRRFRIVAGWKGNQMDETDIGLANTLAASGTSDALYGYGGLTGERSYNSANDSPDCRTLNAERDLPCSPGFGDELTGPRQLPLFFIASDGTKYVDMVSSATSYGLEMGIERRPCAISVGRPVRDDQTIIKTLASQSASKMVATIGFRESAPLRVSWLRDPSTWVRDDPRVLTVYASGCELWTVPVGTVQGLSGTGLDVTTSISIIRDDRDRMRSLLALLKAFYTNPINGLSWDDTGRLDATYELCPGTLITTATVGTGTETVNAIITRRAWTVTPAGVRTSWSAEPIAPSVESFR